jgi:hypothetical protein
MRPAAMNEAVNMRAAPYTMLKGDDSRTRQRLLRRDRDRALRQRRKSGERVYPVLLPDSIVDQLGAGLRPKKADRAKLMTDLEWRRLIGKVIAEIVKSRVTK